MGEKAFRPWNVDALATVVRKGVNGDLTIRYDHAPGKEWVIPSREVSVIGRLVDRADFPALGVSRG